MSQQTENFTWADAWIVVAILWHQRGDAPVDLTTMISAGDAITHAIFTQGELEHGLRRLITAGYVTYEGGGCRVASEVQPALQLFGSPFRQMEEMEKLLGISGRDVSCQPPPADSEQYISAAAYRSALESYLSRMKALRPSS
jgi:hypothetical protein